MLGLGCWYQEMVQTGLVYFVSATMMCLTALILPKSLPQPPHSTKYKLYNDYS